MGNVDQELLFAIQAFGVLLRSGQGPESALNSIAQGDYGEISTQFSRALQSATEKGGIEGSLKALQKETESKDFKKFLNTIIMGLRGDVNIADSLDRISDRVLKERTVETENFIELIAQRTELFMVCGILGPIIIIVLILAENLMTGADFSSSEPFLSPIYATIILFTDWAFLVSLTVTTKLQEPRIA